MRPPCFIQTLGLSFIAATSEGFSKSSLNTSSLLEHGPRLFARPDLRRGGGGEQRSVGRLGRRRRVLPQSADAANRFGIIHMLVYW